VIRPSSVKVQWYIRTGYVINTILHSWLKVVGLIKFVLKKEFNDKISTRASFYRFQKTRLINPINLYHAYKIFIVLIDGNSLGNIQ